MTLRLMQAQAASLLPGQAVLDGLLHFHLTGNPLALFIALAAPILRRRAALSAAFFRYN